MAANAATAKAVLDHLRADRNDAVLVALLTHPSLFFALVEGLAFHRCREVRRLALAWFSGAAAVLQEKAPRAEGAMFPELRERATLAGGVLERLASHRAPSAAS